MTALGRQLSPAALGALIGAALMAGGASGQAPFEGYDGSNPFNCTLQQVGRGTDFPFPDADPFCVEFDKTHQNVDTLGIVDFLSQEPARVAGASDKCFYYQRDHWRSRVVAENEATETYNWDGGYFFDKAKGIGGAHVENFTVNNQTSDPTAFPGFPEEYEPFFGAGRGGAKVAEGIPIEPRCVERAQREDVYAGDARGEPDASERGRRGAERGGSGGPDRSRSDRRSGGAGDPGPDAAARREGPGFSETRADPTFTG